MLVHPAWGDTPSLRHGFLDGRECDGAPDWERVLGRQDVRLPLARPRQVHGATVLLAEHVTPTSEGDAVIATRPGVAVGILTADCVPVLLRDRHQRAVAAVHAGWRGAAAGVLEATLATLQRIAGVDSRDVDAAIGPAASGCCYEVGDDVRGAFGAEASRAFMPRRGRYLFDLREAVRILTESAGVGRVTQLGPCTVCDPAYASYRRDGAAAGRQLSFIGLT